MVVRTLIAALTLAATIATVFAQVPVVPGPLRERVARDGLARVIVEIKLPSPHVPEGHLPNAAAIAAQRRRTNDRRNAILAALPPASHRVLRSYESIPYVALEASPAALDALERMKEFVARVVEDEAMRTVLSDSVPIVQADQAWATGYDGSATTIAVLDTGVDTTHPALAGKVVAEACFSSTNAGTSESTCPSGADEQIGPGSAAPCSLPECRHGTHVAGIAAGVATGASLVAVQVFSKITQDTSCGGVAPCAAAYTSDILAGLEHVYSLAPSYNFAAVNLSLGGTAYPEPCDSEPYKPIIDNLRSVGIATVAASGNSGWTTRISTPACVSSAVSVASTTKADAVSWFSNVAPFLSLFAPGEAIVSSVPGPAYESLSGTSMAAPHVAGAWAIVRDAAPGTSVSTILSSLRSTGLPITDTRLLGATTAPRIRILQAVATLAPVTNPAPAITSLSPASGRVGSAAQITVTGTGFNAFSVVRWNGELRPTTVVNMTKLVAQISATDTASEGTALVDVFTPAPGGGTSGALGFSIVPLPTLSVNASRVAPGSAVTATLANGYGGAMDWIGMYATGAADSTYIRFTYVGAGVTDRTWTVSAPSTDGTYEFRLFVNNTRAATSPSFAVDSSYNPVPAISSLSPANVAVGGAAFTLTVNGSGFTSTSAVHWNGSPRTTTFVSSTQLRAAIDSADIQATGTAQVTVVTPAPGGGTSGALTVAINPPPALTVSATSVAGGASVTVTLTNGFGGSKDWMSLAATTAPNTGYVQYVNVGAGITTRTWTVNMPTTAGTYEFRYFPDGGYTRAATSPPITVSVSSTPSEPPVLSVSATTVGAFENITVTLTNGYGGTTDWLAFALSSAPNSSYVQYTYIGSGVTTKTWTITAPATAGTYEFRLFLNNSYTRAATSPPITVTAPTTSPTLTVSATEVSPGASVTVTLTDGYGGSKDWMAFAAASASPYSYVTYTYVGSGVRTRTWTVTAPTTTGTYEFRLFLDNSYTIAARSAPVVVR